MNETQLSDRKPENDQQYNDPKEVEIYTKYSRKSITAFTERRFINYILKSFGHLSHLNVLDVATGPAWIPIALSKARPTWRMTAIDASPLMLQHAAQNAAEQNVSIRFVHGKAEKINWESEQFDLIISHFAFHEFPDPQGALQEMERLLKPGGFVVVQDLQRPHPWAIWPLVAFATVANWSKAMGLQYYNSLLASYRAAELKRLCATTGLIWNVQTVMRYGGGILRAWGVKPSRELPQTPEKKEAAGHNTPSLEEIERIVEAGNLAPSGDNCQPWHFAWDGKRIEIRFLPEKAEAFLDVRQSASWIALGAVLTNMHIAGQELGFKLELDLFPKGSRKNVVASLEPRPIQKVGHPLYAVLRNRCTNRRAYTRAPIAKNIMSELLQSSNTIPGVSLDFIEDRPSKYELARVIAGFDRSFFHNRSIHDSLHRWVRWTDKEIQQTKDGLPLGSLELDIFTRIFLWATRAWKIARIVAASGFDRIAALRAERVYRASAAFGLLTIDGSDPENFVLGGMVFQRLWLTATLRGIALQPVTGTLFMELKHRSERQLLSMQETRRVQAVRDEMSQLFPSFIYRTPVMLFRMGLATAPSARALRRSLPDIFDRKETPHSVRAGL